MNCENVEHMLVERAEGLLDAPASSELDAHLETCTSCRRAAVDFGTLATRLASAGEAFASTALLVPTGKPTGEPAVAHQAGRTARATAPRVRRARRWAAALAGAAALGAAIILPLAMIDRTTGSAAAATSLTAMSRAIEDARTVQFEIHLVPQIGPEQVGRLSIVADIQMRFEMPDGRVIVADTVSGRTQIRLPSEQKFIEMPAREGEARPFKLYDALVSLASNPSEDLGVEVLDGIVSRVFLVRDPGNDLPPGEYKVWVNPYTSLPMKVEMPGRMGEVALDGGPPGRLILAGFAFDAEINLDLGSFTPPAGYLPAPITADPQATRAQTSATARGIMMGLFMIKNDTGQWPESLRALVDGGQMTAERIRNIRVAPDAADFGWIYLRPTANEPDAQRLVITEPAPEPWTEVIAAFADGHVEVVNDRERYDWLLVRSSGGAQAMYAGGDGVLDRSTAVTVDPTKPIGTLPNLVAVGGTLPLEILNKDDLQGLKVEGNFLAEGQARFPLAGLREGRYMPRSLQVNKFLTPEGTVIVTMPVGVDNPTFGLLSGAAASIDRGLPPVLIDSVGNRHPAVGFAHRTAQEFLLRYFLSDPITSIDQLPPLSAGRPGEKLYLVFSVSQGADLTGFAIGNTLVASFEPPVSTKLR